MRAMADDAQGDRMRRQVVGESGRAYLKARYRCFAVEYRKVIPKFTEPDSRDGYANWSPELPGHDIYRPDFVHATKEGRPVRRQRQVQKITSGFTGDPVP